MTSVWKKGKEKGNWKHWSLSFKTEKGRRSGMLFEEFLMGSMC